MEYQREELLACAIARLIGDARHVAVGAASPIPATACALLQQQGLPLKVFLLQKRTGNPFTEGSRELFDLAGQGRIDVFFLGGAQIDGQGNINLVQAEGRRFPGSFGSAFMYQTVKNVILFREEHSRRVLVPKVEFVSAAGRPAALLTGKALFGWDGGFVLRSFHPGESVASIREATGFEFRLDRAVQETPAPTANELAVLRGPVARKVAVDYPAFARKVWG
ncbi:MAG TPA: CoA-transferase [Burkholderiales bacterium]|nr:CoA-transferase [Burkholderiales bacterium]